MLGNQNVDLAEIFKSIIKELEYEQDIFNYDDCDYGEGEYDAYEEAIKIVEQKAHEYNIQLTEEIEKEEER